eukprot:3091628-Prymnesium_polylepis.1
MPHSSFDRQQASSAAGLHLQCCGRTFAAITERPRPFGRVGAGGGPPKSRPRHPAPPYWIPTCCGVETTNPPLNISAGATGAVFSSRVLCALSVSVSQCASPYGVRLRGTYLTRVASPFT